SNIRQFNSALALASMGAQVEEFRGYGPYSYKIHGQIYHAAGPLHPPTGKAPSYGQLYIMDTKQAAEERLSVAPNRNCDRSIMKSLSKLLAEINAFAKSYKMMFEVEKEGERLGVTDQPVRMIFDINAAKLNKNTYNIPSSNEVAAVFVGDEDGAPPAKSVMAHGRDGQLTTIRDTDPHCDAMVYPIFYPRGTFGWHKDLQKAGSSRKNSRITMLEYYSHILQIRESFNPILFGRNLFQQFAVDAFCKSEQNRLYYLRTHQAELRADEYCTVRDYVAGDKEDGPPGKRIVLPSSFPGSPRAMVQDYQDAMSIVAKYGKPDYFLTMTCNPKWPEIEESLEDGQTASDRPDIVARVFKLKVNALFDVLLKKKLFGEVAAYVQVYEWQKRGLPHAHCLITMKPDFKPKTTADIDNVICAEIPDPGEDPDLFDIVSKNMIHRPCGPLNPKSPCTNDKMECMKRFPKPFRSSTNADVNGYPEYRRRDDGRFVEYGKHKLTNQHVVAYNRTLLLHFNCHLNLEVCAMVEAVKYLYKYVYKGHDRASIQMLRSADDETVDEIKMYLDCRYICAPEALHHIYRFPCQKKSDAIYRLSIHLPDRDPERYALRLLLLYTKGATSFSDLKMTEDDNGIPTVHDTFVEAAKAQSLLSDDAVVIKSLEEMAAYHMPAQLRAAFSAILAFSEIGDTQTLWNLFKKDMSEDFLNRGYDQEESEARAYYDVDERLVRLGKSMETFATAPTIVIDNSTDDFVDLNFHQAKGDQLYATLNPRQKEFCDAGIAAATDVTLPQMFVLDGPGGAGKTYTYNVILHMLRAMNKNVQCTAWTGIASTLLPNGRTSASLFKLNIGNDSKTSNHSKGSKEAKKLKEVDVIIWDECSMISKTALETADFVLRDLTDSPFPFGGKLMVLGGDFRQILPVIRRGTKTDLINNCIKNSYLWNQFQKFSLLDNMRIINGDANWMKFLLDVGDGVANDYEDRVTLPEGLPVSEDLVGDVFGDLRGDMSDAAILAPKNIDVDLLDEKAHSKMEGTQMEYLSRDEVEDESTNKYMTTEFLNSVRTSSLPPHRLCLKVGSVVMLLRNLDVSSGMCNGTRLIVKELQRKCILCTFATGSNKGKDTFVPRITCYEDKNLPFRLKRTQFPVKLAFAISINKAQGQSFGRVGLYLPEDVFAHGQTYVALSRARSKNELFIKSSSERLLNVVYKEIL
uniref:ATP-dependent DNA helicase n=1 Tax=Caenorhabditis japonica TaxID=281687 RepID=A0A8R1I5I4_CAEJA